MAGSALAGEKAGEQVSHFYGSMGYSIPIEVPAYHGLEPRLALSYSSEGRNGQLGVGWTLSGISTIELKNQYYLDGQELVWCGTLPPGSGASCTYLGNYTTRDENYLQIRDLLNGNFRIWGRDGTQTLLSPAQHKWGQVEVTDTKNNKVTYQWNCPGSGTDCYPGTISYNGFSVVFYLETRPDPISQGSRGGVVTTSRRIRSIAVRRGTNLIRAYNLGYATSAATGRSLLTSVQQFGQDAVIDANGVITGGTSLPAQTFAYQNDAVAKSFVPTTGGSGTSWCELPDAFLRTGDFNGDGKTDLYCGSYANVRVALGTDTGFAAPAVWTTEYFASSALGDFNGDGRTDVLHYEGHAPGEGSYVKVALSTGSSFQPMVLWAWMGVCDTTVGPVTLLPGDLNRDGKSDIFCLADNGDGNPVQVGLSTGTSFAVSGWGGFGAGETNTFIDMDGDGYDDWVAHHSSFVHVHRNMGSYFQYPGQIELGCASNSTTWADVNGDGKTDAVCLTDGRVLQATGSMTSLIATPPSGAFCSGTTSFFAADVDGDGTTEILCNNPGAPTNDIQVRKWNGTALGPAETWLGGFCGGNLRLGDFNGDGRTDLACEASTVSYAKAGTGGFQADLMASAGNGLGGTVQATYATSSNFVNTNGPPPKWAITRLTRSDGRGGTSVTDFTYSGGYMDRAERRFMGFLWATEWLPLNAGETSRPYNLFKFRQDLNSAGKLEASYRVTGSGIYLEQREFTYTTNGSTIPRKSQLTSERAYTWDGSGVYCTTTWPCATGKRTFTSHTYDNFGNVTQRISKGDEDVSGDETTSTFTYNANTSAWIVDRLARTWVLAGVGTGGTLLRIRRVYYDSATSWTATPTQGYPTKVDEWLTPHADPNYRVVTTTGYDAYGNVTVVTDPTNRSVTTSWDSTYHVFPTSVANGAGETESTAWDPVCGVPTSYTNANNQVTTFSPADALCRPTTTTLPLGGFETRSYLNLGDPNTQHVRVETPSGDGIGSDYVESYFDGFGRTWKTVKKGPSPTQEIIAQTTYQPRGSVATQTEAYYTGEAPPTTSYKYDALDRLIETKREPSTILSTVSYGLWRQTTTDENGKSVITRFDAYGRQKQVERSLGGGPVYTNYTYDLLGRLTAMSDHLGHSWSWTFDSLSRNTQKSDPDAGTWAFAYDDAGRLTSQTDAKSQTTTFGYDALVGRLTTKTAPGETVTTDYSQPRTGYFNVGLPTTITTPTSVLKLDYDAVGRVVKQTRTLDSVDYVLTRTYDSGGFLRGITYPDGDQVGTTPNPLGYDAAGRLTLVPGILNEVTYDAVGRPLVQTNANGTVTTRTYTGDRGFLTGINTVGGTTIQNLSYTLTTPGFVGLVTQVTSPFANEGWSYDYDDLYRLTSATNLSTPGETQSWTYDEIGRITNNSRVGSYTYPSVGQPRPHAPLTAGPHSFTSYDANGNLELGAGRTLAWNANNRITQATVASTTTTFAYDAFSERVKKTTGANTTRYPFGDDYEIAPDGTVTKYISIDSLGVVAKRVGPVASAQTFWHHTDRLGSINAITDVGGIEVFRKKYRPYGDTLAESGSNTESRGWIDQRNDTETGLTYLHARYYDPILGTFTSPDPLHPAVAGVGMHRYGYGLGNPLYGADRSGLNRPGDPCYEPESSYFPECGGNFDWLDPFFDPWFPPHRPSNPCGDGGCGGGGGGVTPRPEPTPEDLEERPLCPECTRPPSVCADPPCGGEDAPTGGGPTGGAPTGGQGGPPRTELNPFVGNNPAGVFNPPNPNDVLRRPVGRFFGPPSSTWAGRFERNAWNNLEKELAAFWDGFIPGWDPFDGLYGDCPECQWSRGIGTATFLTEAYILSRGRYRFGNHGPHHTFGPLGRLPHLQWNAWLPGVRNSGSVIRIPYPRRWR